MPAIRKENIAAACHKRGLDARKELLWRFEAALTSPHMKEAMQHVTIKQRSVMDYYLNNHVTFADCAKHFDQDATQCRKLFVTGMQKLMETVVMLKEQGK